MVHATHTLGRALLELLALGVLVQDTVPTATANNTGLDLIAYYSGNATEIEQYKVDTYYF